MKTVVVAILLVCAVALCTARPRGQKNGQQGGILRYKVRKGGNLLTGKYYRRDLRLGLRFRMTADRVDLRTWNRRPLVSIGDKMLNRTARLVEFMGEQFLQMRQGGNKAFFGVKREGKRKMVSRDLKSGMPMNRTMGENETQSMYERAVSSLLTMPEAPLIVELAKALGNDSVTGERVPASLNFYALAMRIQRFLTQQVGRQQRSAETQEGVETNEEHSVKKRFFGDLISIIVGCDRDPIGSDCLGRCGRGCECWSWVCGDCCYHHGCYLHDLCCDVYTSVACLSFWNFSCGHYSC